MSKERLKYRSACTLLVLLVAGVLVEATLPPSINNHTISNLDKLTHFLGYGTIAWLGGYIVHVRRVLLSVYHLAVIALSTTLLGLAAEIIQSYTPGRDSSIADIAADFIGACFFLVLIRSQNRLSLKHV